MVLSFLGKQYKLASSEKFDEYMKAVGVGLITRKMGAAVSPVLILEKEGEDYTLKSNSTFKNIEVKFKVGEEFDEETPDGRKVKSLITIDGNTMTHTQKDDKKETKIVRVFSDDEVKMTISVDDIVCTRIYKPL